jgi:biopolymer transport protein ExbD
MAFHRSIRFRRNRKRINKTFELQLTSMMDILVIMLVFLLRSYAISTNNFQSVPGIKIPYSTSPDVPPDSLHLIVTPEALTFENERIMDFVQTADSVAGAEPTYTFKQGDLAEDGRQIRPLFDALVKARDKAEFLRAQSKARDAQGNPLPFDGVLAIQADKRITYDTLRRIMYTAGTANYKIFRLLALKLEK